MSAKRQLEICSTSSVKKRKHNSLTLARKVELLKKLQQGTSIMKLCAEYEIGKSTIYDLLRQKEKILKFVADTDSPVTSTNRKTLRLANNDDLDKVLYEWIRQRRSENVPLTGPLITEQAKIFHENMGIATPCNYSVGWLQKFKKRHGIRQLQISGEKGSADEEACDMFVDEFVKMVNTENLSMEQIYNADETSLFWRYVPRKTLATANERNPTGIKDIKERVTVLGCANAAGSHKLKLLVIGKSAKPRALKGIITYPVIYRSNKRAWITQELFKEWFTDCFVPAARAHCDSVGLAKNAKIVLLLDNCSAHPGANILNSENVQVKFLPPNCTSILQPMDQGVLRALKCKYKNDFLRKMLEYINEENNISDFVKEFSIKDALWCAANAWNSINKNTLKNAWRMVLPTVIFNDDEDNSDFEGFRISQEKKKVSELMEYAKNWKINLEQSDLNDIFSVDNNIPVVNSLTDAEIMNSILSKDEDSTTDEESDTEECENENISTENLIGILDTAIKGLENRSYILEHELMTVYKIREKVAAHKPKLKQLSLLNMFKI